MLFDPYTRLPERFTNKFVVEPNTGCWLWTAYADPYGRFWFDGVLQRAHSFAYQMLVGPVPDGLELDHLCRTPVCVNPEHLEAVSHHENVARGERNECSRGHIFTTENTTLLGTTRICRACSRIRDEDHRRKRGTPARHSTLFCPKGHAMFGDKLLLTRMGHRRCRDCTSEAQRRYKAKKREAANAVYSG